MKIFNIKYPKFYRPAKLPPRLNIDFTRNVPLGCQNYFRAEFFVFTSELRLGVWSSNYQGIKNKPKLTSDKVDLVVVVVSSVTFFTCQTSQQCKTLRLNFGTNFVETKNSRVDCGARFSVSL